LFLEKKQKPWSFAAVLNQPQNLYKKEFFGSFWQETASLVSFPAIWRAPIPLGVITYNRYYFAADPARLQPMRVNFLISAPLFRSAP